MQSIQVSIGMNPVFSEVSSSHIFLHINNNTPSLSHRFEEAVPYSPLQSHDNFKHSVTQTKFSAFYKCHLQNPFHISKLYHNTHGTITNSSGNGLLMARIQAIVWINKCKFYSHIDTSLGHEFLTHSCAWYLQYRLNIWSVSYKNWMWYHILKQKLSYCQTWVHKIVRFLYKLWVQFRTYI